MPVSKELHMVKGGNNPCKRKYVARADPDSEVESFQTQISDASHGPSRTVSGSGRLIVLPSRTLSSTQPNVVGRGTQESALAVPRKVSKPASNSEAQRSSQQDHSQSKVVTGGGKRLDQSEEQSDSETSDASDCSSSDVDASESDSQSDEVSTESNCDEEQTSVLGGGPKGVTELASNKKPASSRARAVYFRAHPNISTESASEIQQRLQLYLPDATVMMEFTNLKTSYLDREVLNNMLSEVVDGKINEVWVADSNHICATKDGFSVFALLCHKLGVKVYILPAFQSV
jgi:hypothetical protein